MTNKSNFKYQEKRFEEIALFIKNYRLNTGLTQLGFSKLCNVHVNSIQRFERGDKNISLLTLFLFIDAMDMTIAEFFEGIN